jgi:DNA-binding CsgD family transcriptional regulator
LVLVLEDLHWADESTLDWLQFLLLSTTGIAGDESVPGQGLLVVGTFRDEGPALAPTLTRTVSMLLAKRIARQIDLRPLTSAQLARLLDATLGHPLPADVVEALCERSEGNPFIAEELLSAMAAAGYLDGAGGVSADVATLHLPLSLRGAVLERLDLLPASARQLLSAAAVAGRAFDLALLAGVTELDDYTLLEGLRLAVRGGLIEENPAQGGSRTSTAGDRYRFRHALTREVVYAELLGPERRALHAAVAHALEERLSTDALEGAAGQTIEALAYHYRLAGDRVKAPAFALRAAERARGLLAFAEARRHYAEALSYLSEGDPARLPLLESLGLLSLALLDMQGAVSYLDAAITLLRALGLARKAAVVLGEMHHLLWFVDLARFRAMVEELDTAAEAARSGADGAGPEDADALKTYAAAALAHAVYANYARADLWARRALDLAATLDQAGLPAAPAAYKALLARGHARLHGKLGEGRGEQEIAQAGIRDEYQTLELGVRHALPEVVQLAYNFLPRGLLEVGRDAEAATLIDAADAYARRSGVAAIADTRGYSRLFAGRWAEGITAMREAVATSRAIGSPGKLALELTALGHLLVAQGDGPGATEVLEEALAILEPSGQWVILAPCFTALARARALLGDDDGAAALFARAHALWRSTQDRGTVVLVLLDGCLFHAQCGDAQRAMEWAEGLARVAGHDPVPVAAAAAAHARGAALAAQGGYAAALGPLGDAVQRWEALGRPYAAARARAALGTALLATSPRDQARRVEADTVLVAAEETFRRLGAAHDVTCVEGVRRRGGLLAQARRRQTLSHERAPFGDLTPREREVLILLARGHTNREIAQALFIAEGTAELHVSRILGKLGCATRAQAAAYAVAHGLAEAT